MQNERRKDERKPLILEVRSDDLGQAGLRTADLSLGGCYIEAMGQVTVGSKINLEIRLQTGDWMPFHGEVVYHHPTVGFGLHFTDLTEEQKNQLALIISGAG